MLTIRGRLITPFFLGVHVCWSEHSDSSFVYRFMSLDYGVGTMTATTYRQIWLFRILKPGFQDFLNFRTFTHACMHLSIIGLF